MAGLCVAAAGGCGGGGGEAAAESFDDVLRGLRSAAKSKATYDALAHSEDLQKRQKAVINAFCSVTTQLADNNESVTDNEYFERIKREAEDQLGYASKGLNGPLGKLRATYDLASINGRAAQLYVQACY